jgi:dTDP-glucose 4,6-dehydratase
MTILVTGGAGFIGSNFIPYYLEQHQDVSIINIDKLTYAGELSNLEEIKGNERYTFVKGDICDRNLIEELFNKYQFKGVIHFAAESHVDNSIENPDEFIQTNILGTFNLLDVAKNHWMNAPFQIKQGYESCRFLHISTDEVYGTLGKTGLFIESTPYAPNSPYSASKASSDFIVRSYFHTYGMNSVTTNCSNNYGPKQHDEKLIPTIIRKALAEKLIPIYGDGKNIRDWLFVLDHCKGIDLAFRTGKSGETYNIGGRNERNNLEIVNTICKILDEIIPRKNKTSYKELIGFVKDRPGHDFRYAIDASKIESELEWRAEENFETGIKKTVNWYLNKLKK